MLLDRLIARLTEGSGPAWGYGYRDAGDAEPTALAALALTAHGAAPDRSAAALGWLAERQGDDGGVAIREGMSEPCWPTALALLAWARAGAHPDARRDAKDFLLELEGTTSERSPLFGHDTRVVGWPWVPGTYAWVEPTAYGVLALGATGQGAHPRVAEGRRLLRDRCLEDGGWNYGNTRVMHNTLRPFPATTGVALCALAGTDADADASLDWLAELAPRLNAPLSLGWAALGLRAWERVGVAEIEPWLTRVYDGPGRRPPDPLHDALLLLALADSPWSADG